MKESTWYMIKYSIDYVFEKNIKLMDINPYRALPSEAISIGEILEKICIEAKEMYNSLLTQYMRIVFLYIVFFIN